MGEHCEGTVFGYAQSRLLIAFSIPCSAYPSCVLAQVYASYSISPADIASALNTTANGTGLMSMIPRRGCEGDLYQGWYNPQSDSFEMDSGSRTGGFQCPHGALCIIGENPFEGHLNFDNIKDATFTIFLSQSLDGWCQVMYLLMDSTNPMAACFNVLCVLFHTI